MRLRLEEADGVADIIDLLERDQAPLRPLAAAEAAIVKAERDETGLDKDLGVVRENQRTNPGETMAEYDSGAPLPALRSEGIKRSPSRRAPSL